MGNKGMSVKQAQQQQKTEADGKKVVKVLIGIAQLTPIGKALTKAAVTIADKTDHGSATKYLGKSNSSIDMLPGGALAQAVASASTNGKSDKVLAKYDPKAAIVNKGQVKATTIAKGLSSKIVKPSLLTHK
jgi:hypothetical protein